MARPLARSTRIAWPLLLVLVLGVAGSDLVLHPFRPFQPRADAADRGAGLRLSIAGTEADGGPTGFAIDGAPAGEQAVPAAGAEGSIGPVVAALATTLGNGARAERLAGATTTAVETVLGLADGSDHRLLVLTPQTLVQLQRDRRERIVPGVAVRAERAWRQLVRARPVATIAADPLVLSVRAGSRLRTTAQLSHDLRVAPGRRVFGIEDDSWTRAALATLVRDSGVEGTVTYRPFASAREAAIAVADGQVDVLISTRTAARAVPEHPRLRPLAGAWPGPAPARWIALVAPPATSSATLARLRARIGRALAGERWQRTLRAHGLTPSDPRLDPGPFLADERRRSAVLNATLARVDLSAGG